MSNLELRLFEAFCASCDNYLEYGCGGSTFVAAGLTRCTVTTLDSSQTWLERVSDACRAAKCPVTPSFIYVDIGPTGDWGVPIDGSTRDRWPAYYEAIWARPQAAEMDLYLVDGRFRVACFIKTLLNCRPDAIIMIHDFTSRPHYRVIHEVAREVARSEDLSAFVRRPGQQRLRMEEILKSYRFDAA